MMQSRRSPCSREAENEAWANNASAEFVARFQIFLGGTAVHYLDRLSVLDELLAEERPSLTSLVVRALARIGDQHASRMGSGPASDELPEREWQPLSLPEHLQCVDAAIAKLKEIAKRRIADFQADFVAAANELSMLLQEPTVMETHSQFL